MFFGVWQLSGQQYCVVSIWHRAVWERSLSYGTLCCHRQPVKMLLGDCKSWSQWQTSFWKVTLDPLKLRPACGGGNVGDWLPTLISNPGKKSWATEQKDNYGRSVAVWKTSCPVFPPPCPSLEMLKVCKKMDWKPLFEKIDFMKLGHKTSNNQSLWNIKTLKAGFMKSLLFV